jgi:arsenate reductase
MPRRRVLFLCIGNSARSQMAEGFVNAFLGHRWAAHSAGARPAAEVHPLAITVMAEAGVDISGHHAKALTIFRNTPFDLVVTVCGEAEQCPAWLGPEAQRHVPFPDPAAAVGDEAQRLATFRQVRDAIRAWVMVEMGEGRE